MVKLLLLPTVLTRGTLRSLHKLGHALPSIFGNELELSFTLAASKLKCYSECYFKILFCVCSGTVSSFSSHYMYLHKPK